MTLFYPNSSRTICCSKGFTVRCGVGPQGPQVFVGNWAGLARCLTKFKDHWQKGAPEPPGPENSLGVGTDHRISEDFFDQRPAWHHDVLSQQWLSMAVVFQTERCLHISIESMRAVEMKHVVHGILFISCFTCFHMYPQTLDTDCIFVDVPFDMEATESFGFCVTTDHRLSMINVGCTIVNIIYDIH